MVHIAEEKLSARGIGAYARRTLQPLGGRKIRVDKDAEKWKQHV